MRMHKTERLSDTNGGVGQKKRKVLYLVGWSNHLEHSNLRVMVNKTFLFYFEYLVPATPRIQILSHAATEENKNSHGSCRCHLLEYLVTLKSVINLTLSLETGRIKRASGRF